MIRNLPNCPPKLSLFIMEYCRWSGRLRQSQTDVGSLTGCSSKEPRRLECPHRGEISFPYQARMTILKKMLLQIPNMVRAEMAVQEPVPAGSLLYMHLLTFLKPGLYKKDILIASEVC